MSGARPGLGGQTVHVPFRDVPFLSRDIQVERRDDGTCLVRNRAALRDRAPHIPWYLRRNADTCPDRVWIAQRRGVDGGWASLTYAEGLRQVDAVTEWLLRLPAAGRPVMVLSGNSIEHAVLALAAMQAGMPHVPVTSAYSLRSTDFARLRAMVGSVDPAVVFAQDADEYRAALAAVAGPERTVIAVEGEADPGRFRWSDILGTEPSSRVEESLTRIDLDTVAKYMFTSGSLTEPKAVTMTQRMLVTATASNAMNVDRARDPYRTIMVDWLPWSHVAGGCAVFNRILEEMGTLYIDDGRPTPDGFGPTLANLREISPSNFSSMPIGYAMLVDAMDADEELGRSFFANLRFAAYSGARLPDDTYARFQAHAIAHTGRRIPFTSGYGSTETTAACAYVYWPAERPGLVGLPQVGVDIKLVPIDGERYEVRVHSDTVTPGYLGQPDLTRASFDEEGYYCMGDAAVFVEPDDPSAGLAFAGRVAEEFKLQSGTFVRVTSLRVAILDATAPWLTDLVVAGADQPYIGLLAWPNWEVCRTQLGVTDGRDPAGPLVDVLKQTLAEHNRRSPSTSTRVRRVLLLREPPSQAMGEINDKGYVNQRRVLELRAAEAAALFSAAPHRDVIVIE